jgi:hypothetical protein
VVYLYAALGVVMMTGIMAVVEMGLSLTGQSFILKSLLSSVQKESINELKQLDQDLLRLLSKTHEVQGLDPLGSPKGSPLKGSSLCTQVMCRINRQSFCLGEASDAGRPLLPPVESLRGLGQSDNFPSGQWSNSCALERGGKHRFLIRSDSQIDENLPYYLYSCSLYDQGLESDLGKCSIEASL